MRKRLFTTLLIFTMVSTVQGQAVYSFYSHSTGNGSKYSILEYQYLDKIVRGKHTVNLGKDNNLRSASTLDWNTKKLIIITDSNLSQINVLNGNVKTKTIPFTTFFSQDLCLKYDGISQKIYFLHRDVFDKVSVGEYDANSNSLKNVKSFHHIFNLDGESAAFDSKNKAFILATDTGMCKVNALTGVVTYKSYPFASRGGFRLALHYDENDNSVYALLRDAYSKITVSKYDFESNTMNQSHTLDSATFGSSSGYFLSSTYDKKNKNIVVRTDTGISVVNVISGSIVKKNLPVPLANLRVMLLEYDPTLLVSTQSVEKQNLKIFPNPASSKIMIEGYDGETVHIRIISLNGEIVFKNSILLAGSTIDVSSLKNGIYVAEIEIGSQLVRKKLIVSSN